MTRRAVLRRSPIDIGPLEEQDPGCFWFIILGVLVLVLLIGDTCLVDAPPEAPTKEVKDG